MAWKRFAGKGPRCSGQALIRDGRTHKPLFVIDLYDNPIGMAQIAMYDKRAVPRPEDIMSGGDLIRRALKRRGLDPDAYFFTLFETRDTTRFGSPRRFV